MANFKEIIGQSSVKSYLQKAVELKRVSHAYILSADSGYGKKTLAEAFAMTLECEAGGTDACLSCPSCKKALSGNHPDIIHIQRSKPNTITVDDIREQINQTAPIKPYAGPYKIYIVPDAEKMNAQAQNALLKTIEEPPEYVVILLLTANENELLPTIISRCVKLQLRPVSQDLVEQYLMEHYQVPDYKAKICASFAQGNMGKAIKIATMDKFSELKDEVLSLVCRIREMPVSELIDYMKKLEDYKLEIHDYLDFMAVWYRDVLMFKATKDINMAVFAEQAHEIMRQADKISYEGLENIIRALNNANRRLDANVNFELTMELLFLTIKEE